MKETWVITDTHFHHDSLIEYCGRPQNFTELIIKNWQETVGEDDLVIHLGDISMEEKLLASELLDLPGRKVLVQGNHDEKSRKWYMEHGFDFVCDMFMWDFRGKHLVFTHAPLQGAKARALAEWDLINICGHIHNNSPSDHGYTMTKYHRLIVLEDLEYKPITLSSIIK